MVQWDALDILPGLEDAYFSILQFTSNILQTGAQSRITPSSRYRATQLQGRSLIVLWYPLYDSFDSGRKAAWTDYWSTLPFGSHSGSGGWPGSGFSAFIYTNAPRYKAGLDLLLDPGFYTGEILINTDFSGGGTNWSSDGGNFVGDEFQGDDADTFFLLANSVQGVDRYIAGATYRSHMEVLGTVGSCYWGLYGPDIASHLFDNIAFAGQGFVEVDWVCTHNEIQPQWVAASASSGPFDLIIHAPSVTRIA